MTLVERVRCGDIVRVMMCVIHTPFAAAQGDMVEGNGVTPAGSRVCHNAVLLSVAMHFEARRERPFAAAQGDMVEGNGVTWSRGMA
jgi:hypothetical protein